MKTETEVQYNTFTAEHQWERAWWKILDENIKFLMRPFLFKCVMAYSEICDKNPLDGYGLLYPYEYY